MSNKLQELTDKLYNEGLSKGRDEGERILSEARDKAAAIIAEAEAKAKALGEKAEADAKALKDKAASDIRMASAQALEATKKDIENLLSSNIISAKVDSTLSDTDFVKSIIKCVAEKFSATESADLALVLPEKMKAELEPWVAGELSKSLGKGVSAEFSKKIAGGFNIGPRDGSWFISLNDATFNSLIAEYLRPVTRKLIFGE